MREVKNMPETSLAAHRDLTPEKLSKDYGDIIFALKSIKIGNYERISQVLGWQDINKCSRRLKEMERMQIIYKPGSKSLTSRRKQAFNYALVENGEQSAQPEKVMQGTTISDYSKNFIQKTLF